MQSIIKSFSLALAFSGLSLAGLQAQSGPYLRLALGGSLPATGDVLGTNTQTDAAGQTTQSNVYGSFGGGLGGSLAGGYFFNEHLGIDLEFNYLYGRRTLANRNSNAVNNSESTVHAYTRQLRTSPSLVVRSGGEKLRGFARAGLLLPLTGSTYRENYSLLANGAEFRSKIRVNGAPSLGFVAGAGLSYALNDKLSLQFEAVYTGLRIKNAKGEIILDEQVINGNTTNNLENTTVFQREFRFVDELNAESNNVSMRGINGLDTNKPNDQLASRVNFSNLGFFIGLNFRFGGGE